jgi:hypothetical protein
MVGFGGLRLVPFADKPGQVSHKVDAPAVADPEPGAITVVLELMLLDDLTQRSRVQEPEQIDELEAARVGVNDPSSRTSQAA